MPSRHLAFENLPDWREMRLGLIPFQMVCWHTQGGQPGVVAIVFATPVISHAFSISSTSMSRSCSLWTPSIILRTQPRRVTGGGWKLDSPTSTTPPISSPNSLAAPSSDRAVSLLVDEIGD